MTLTVTSVGGILLASGKGALVFVPATSITDGNPAGGTFTTLSGFRLFWRATPATGMIC